MTSNVEKYVRPSASAAQDAPEPDDKLHEECGVFGVWAPGRDVARITYFGLRALQHRGQDSAGIAVGDGKTVLVRKDLGLVTQVFTDADLSAMPGKVACGHCRYGTAGAKGWESAQPHLSMINDVIIALAHNGTLVNFDSLRHELIEMGIPFRSNTDSEVAAKLIGYFTQRGHRLRTGIAHTMRMLEGATPWSWCARTPSTPSATRTASAHWSWASWTTAPAGSWPARRARWTLPAPPTCARLPWRDHPHLR